MADRWWAWKLGYRNGKAVYVAFNKEHPIHDYNGDPLALGEPHFSGTNGQVKALALDAEVYFRQVRGRGDSDIDLLPQSQRR